jgi:hypothetical protein
MSVKYYRVPLNISSFSNLALQNLPNLDFWSEHKPSGNPGYGGVSDQIRHQNVRLGSCADPDDLFRDEERRLQEGVERAVGEADDEDRRATTWDRCYHFFNFWQKIGGFFFKTELNNIDPWDRCYHF